MVLVSILLTQFQLSVGNRMYDFCLTLLVDVMPWMYFCAPVGWWNRSSIDGGTPPPTRKVFVVFRRFLRRAELASVAEKNCSDLDDGKGGLGPPPPPPPKKKGIKVVTELERFFERSKKRSKE